MIKLFCKIFGVAQYKNTKGIVYYLHSMIVKLGKSGHTQKIYWFSRQINNNSVQSSFPKNTVVHENPRSKMPYLKFKLI